MEKKKSKTWMKLFTLLLTLFLFGCASAKNDIETAKAQNTIQAYETFIKKHPKSEYVNDN